MPRTRRPRRRVLGIERHEAAIDHDDAAAGQLRRREHPVARAGDVGPERRAGGIDQRFLALEEFGRKRHTGIFAIRLHQLRPIGARRQIARRAGAARGHRGDQIFLPGLAVELPDAEADQDGHAGNGENRRLEDAPAFFRQPVQTSLRRSRRPSAAL
jgi:hypothetical protein